MTMRMIRTGRKWILALLLPVALLALGAQQLGNILTLTNVVFASFPAAAAVNTGGLLWDSTNNVVKRSNGTVWSAIDGTAPFTLFSVYINGSTTTSTQGGHALPARAFTVTGMSIHIVASATGAGNWTSTLSDGVNTCIATWPCVQTALTSTRVTTTNGAGTGCVYAASAVLKLTSSTAACAGGTGPTALNEEVEGNWP